MEIEHIAIWTRDLEGLTSFYRTYFGARAGPKYTNPGKGFESCFLSFSGGTRLELMGVSGLMDAVGEGESPRKGYAHLAISVGSEERVDELTALLRREGVPVVDGPRRTGDGYYESCVLDPDGNRIEITV
jgi:lactoylglutathione lyase